jgi:hypothetical protein
MKCTYLFFPKHHWSLWHTTSLGLLSPFALSLNPQIPDSAWMSIEYGIITRNYAKNEMIIMDFGLSVH